MSSLNSTGTLRILGHVRYEGSRSCLHRGAVALLHTLRDRLSAHLDNGKQLSDQHEGRDVAKATGGVTASGELPTQRYDRPVSQSEPAREAQLFG